MADQLPKLRFEIPFMRFKWAFISLSLVLIAATFYFVAARGLNFGVDFKGGVKLVYKFQNPTTDGEVRGSIEALGLGEVQVIRYGAANEMSYLIKTKFAEGKNVTQEITRVLEEKFGPGSVTLLTEESVGPKVGKELRKRGLFALLLAWALILVYVGIRFDFLFAPGAVIALLHDVIIPIGFFAFLGKEINLPILAAALTIIGFSINDTVVIFDRIRENLRKLPSSVPLTQLVERSLNETLSRTIITSLTVLFAVVVLFVLGGAVLHDFAFFMIVGVIAGTYSTMFIASPIYLALQKMFPHKGLTRSTGKR